MKKERSEEANKQRGGGWNGTWEYGEKTDTVGIKRNPKKNPTSSSSIGENTFFSSL